MACRGVTGAARDEDQKTCECGHEQPYPDRIFIRRNHVGHRKYEWGVRLPVGVLGPNGHPLVSERAYVRADVARTRVSLALEEVRKALQKQKDGADAAHVSCDGNMAQLAYCDAWKEALAILDSVRGRV